MSAAECCHKGDATMMREERREMRAAVCEGDESVNCVMIFRVVGL